MRIVYTTKPDELAAHLIANCCSFTAEPYPFDDWRFTVKPEARVPAELVTDKPVGGPDEEEE